MIDPHKAGLQNDPVLTGRLIQTLTRPPLHFNIFGSRFGKDELVAWKSHSHDWIFE